MNATKKEYVEGGRLMSRPAHELATHLERLARELEQVERATFQRRMMPALELEMITARREIGAMKGSVIRVELIQNARVLSGACTKRGLALALRREAPTPIVRGNAESLIAMGAYVPEGGDPMRPLIEWEPGRYAECEVIQ